MISTEDQQMESGRKYSHCPHRHRNAPSSCPTDEGKDIQEQPEISHGVNTFGKHSNKHNKLSLAPCLCLLWGHFLTGTAQVSRLHLLPLHHSCLKYALSELHMVLTLEIAQCAVDFFSLFMTTATPGT